MGVASGGGSKMFITRTVLHSSTVSATPFSSDIHMTNNDLLPHTPQFGFYIVQTTSSHEKSNWGIESVGSAVLTVSMIPLLPTMQTTVETRKGIPPKALPLPCTRWIFHPRKGLDMDLRSQGSEVNQDSRNSDASETCFQVKYFDEETTG